MKTHMLIIDPQNDFCNPNGALFVPGADQDAVRLAATISRLTKKIDDIHVTLDSHRLIDVAHPIFWVNSAGKHPNPFTIISEEDVVNGVWTTTNPGWKQKGLDYVKALTLNGRYPLCIWPAHCMIGDTKEIEIKDRSGNPVIVDGQKLTVGFSGHSVEYHVAEALMQWQEARFGVVNYCVKGSNLFTEHYSALQADVPDPADPTTQINTDLLYVLQNADEIVISGEALSHCVANTITDIANNFGEENIKKFILLQDCCSNVPGFENLGTTFVNDMRARGMQVTTSVDYLA